LKRLAIAALIAVLALAWLLSGTATARTARIGPRLPQTSAYALKAGDSYTLIQERPPMWAPFKGTITRFRVQGLKGTVRLQVLHRLTDTMYKVRSQSALKRATVGNHAVASFHTKVAVNKGGTWGDYVCIQVKPNSQFRVATTRGRYGLFYETGLVVGEKGFLSPYTHSTGRMLFNATVGR
jgi:hypothetical protein